MITNSRIATNAKFDKDLMIQKTTSQPTETETKEAGIALMFKEQGGSKFPIGCYIGYPEIDSASGLIAITTEKKKVEKVGSEYVGKLLGKCYIVCAVAQIIDKDNSLVEKSNMNVEIPKGYVAQQGSNCTILCYKGTDGYPKYVFLTIGNSVVESNKETFVSFCKDVKNASIVANLPENILNLYGAVTTAKQNIVAVTA